MNRFSVIYQFREQYHHVSCNTRAEAESVLKLVPNHKGRTPVGIYDAKTELFDWDASRQDQYDRASFEGQGQLGEQIITIAQALRRRDANWQKAGEFRRPSFFA
jgi:hypothetical protein